MTLSLRELKLLHEVLGPLEDMGLITMDEAQAEKCCGIFRDEKGRCQHRPHHPVFVRLPEDPADPAPELTQLEKEVLHHLRSDVAPPTEVSSLCRWTNATEACVLHVLEKLKSHGCAQAKGRGWVPR